MFISTKDFAAYFDVKAQSVLKRKCEQGSYFGYKPIKRPNGRLAWPIPSIEKPMISNIGEIT